MTTEREQLEMAAKACGVELVWANDSSFCFIPSQKAPQNRRAGDEMQGVVWNPLTDDGDALRLAVKCGISFEWVNRADYPDPMRWASSPVGLIAGTDDVAKYGWVTTLFGDDAYAATRRAIVLAAAEIGRLK